MKRLLVPLVLAVALLAGCGSSTAPKAAARAPKYFQGTETDIPLPSALLHAAFTDSTGRTVHLADLTGKTVVISDSMTLCQEACPIDTATLVSTASQWAKTDPANTVFLTITVDPQRDDPAQLAAYRKLYVGSGLPSWQLWTGAPAVVAALWKHLGVYVEKVPQDDVVKNWRTGAKLTYDVEHSDEVFFFDTRLRERYILDGMPSIAKGADRGSVPKRLQPFLSGQGKHNELSMKGWTAPQALGVLSWLSHL